MSLQATFSILLLSLVTCIYSVYISIHQIGLSKKLLAIAVGSASSILTSASVFTLQSSCF